MKWDEIKQLFEEFGWEVTSDLAVEYQENPWTHRLLDALLATVDDRNEIEATIDALKEDRDEARVEAAVLQDEVDVDVDARRLQNLVDAIANQPMMNITIDTLGPKRGVLLTPDQIKELTALATFPSKIIPASEPGMGPPGPPGPMGPPGDAVSEAS